MSEHRAPNESPVADWPVAEADGAVEPALLREVLDLAGAAREADGNPPFSEQTLVDLRFPDSGVRLFTCRIPGTGADAVGAEAAGQGPLAGAAVLVPAAGDADDAPAVLELVVDPGCRGKGVGQALAAAVAQASGTAPQAWSHGNHDAAARLAAGFGYRPVRELWKMRLTRSTLAQPLPEVRLPDGVRLRAFEPGRDEDAWLAANAAAFSHHPEQGALTRADLEARMEEDWFDPAGFLLAVREDDGELLGFHWTKVHAGSAGHPDVGEVYVVGVVPGAQGTGLGKALTLAGIDHLHRAGLDSVMLYVDADNAPATALYGRLGFVRWDVDVMYAKQDTDRL